MDAGDKINLRSKDNISIGDIADGIPTNTRTKSVIDECQDFRLYSWPSNVTDGCHSTGTIRRIPQCIQAPSEERHWYGLT